MGKEMSVEEKLAALQADTSARMSRLESDITEIKANVARLMAFANRGRGTLAALFWLGGAVVAILGVASSVAHLLAEWLGGK